MFYIQVSQVIGAFYTVVIIGNRLDWIDRTHVIHITGLATNAGVSDAAAMGASEIPCMSRACNATSFGANKGPSLVKDWTADWNRSANLQQSLVKYPPNRDKVV
jgi:hypothetical protein